MIYTYTLNPALDVTGFVEHIIPNEKNYVYDVHYLPGGNGINAGIIAKRLGAKVMMRGFLGGINGVRIRNSIEREGIEHFFIEIEDETRMNVTVSNKENHLQTRLSFPGPKIKKVEIEKFIELNEDIFEGSIIILGGSVPSGIENVHLEDAITRWREKNTRLLIDVPSRHLKHLIDLKPDFIKPNLIEFQELVQKEIFSIKEIIPAARELLAKVPNICISSVEDGALFITKEEIWYGRIPAVEIHSTVGAGDSMVGAMAQLWDVDKFATAEKLLRAGLSAACATLTKKGSTLGDKEAILKFLPEIILQKLA